MLEEMVASVIFLSTPSARRATLAEARAVYGPPISIHALREEGDISPDKYGLQPHYFYPRPPRGGRHGQTVKATERGNFYPRPPRGGRPETLRNPCTNERFLSTPSARRATDVRGALAEYIKFLSTPSARRATQCKHHCFFSFLFLSTPSARRATATARR